MKPTTLSVLLLVLTLFVSAALTPLLAAPAYCNIMLYPTGPGGYGMSCGGLCVPPHNPCLMLSSRLPPPKDGRKWYCVCDDGPQLPPVGTCSGWIEQIFPDQFELFCDNTQCPVDCDKKEEHIPGIGLVKYCQCP